MTYHFTHIAEITGGKIIQINDDSIITQLVFDSRTIIFPAHSVFFALKGGHRNGHDFLADVYRAGTRNFIVESIENINGYADANIILVNNTLEALQALAAYHRNLFDIPVIGITGSNGKTIVKEWINQLLNEWYQVVRSPKSYNSQIGVPLSVWQMNESHNLAIFEAGISKKGEMQNLEPMIRPSIGVFTNAGEAHSENFSGIREKVREKLQLFMNASLVVFCSDHEVIAEEWEKWTKEQWLTVKAFTWSREKRADVFIEKIEKHDNYTEITASYQRQNIRFSIPFIDDASIENAIHCFCVLLHLNISFDRILNTMPKLGAVAMRLELKEGINNCSIINDSYSADLSSLQIALDFLAQQQQHRKKTVILTDILESGRSEKDLYGKIALLLSRRGITRIIGIGDTIGANSSIFTSLAGTETRFYASVEAFRKAFDTLDFRDETILIKGARKYGLEKVSRMLEQKIHETVLEIDLNAIVHNLNEYRKLTDPSVKIMAMVKAFSYGSGSFEIANVLQYNKVDYLAVAYADEGVALRKAGITLPVMVMNPDEHSFGALVRYKLEPELYSFRLMRAFSAYLREQEMQGYPVHVEIETGMNRLGFSEDDSGILIEELLSGPFRLKSVFTHLVASEDAQHDAFSRQQAEKFQSVKDRIKKALPYDFLSHISNSAGVSRHRFHFGMVRLGIGLYGIDSGKSSGLHLIQVSALKSNIAQIKKVKAGDTVGYGRKGFILEDSKIATVRIGYADGYPRQLSNGVGKMWVNGYMAPVIGTICMDMTMIDITHIPDIEEGDEVIIFGRQLPVQQVAEWAGTIPYEILAGVSQRVRRVYFQQ